MGCGGSVLGFGVVEINCVVFITVVGPQVEVHDDLHLLGEMLEHIPLKEEIADGSNGVEIELSAEVAEDVSPGKSVFAVHTERRDSQPAASLSHRQ